MCSISHISTVCCCYASYHKIWQYAANVFNITHSDSILLLSFVFLFRISIVCRCSVSYPTIRQYAATLHHTVSHNSAALFSYPTLRASAAALRHIHSFNKYDAALLHIPQFGSMMLFSCISHNSVQYHTFSTVCCCSYAAALLHIDSMLLLCFISYNSTSLLLLGSYHIIRQYAAALCLITYFASMLLLCFISLFWQYTAALLHVTYLDSMLLLCFISLTIRQYAVVLLNITPFWQYAVALLKNYTLWQYAANAVLYIPHVDSMLMLCFLSYNSTVGCCSACSSTFQKYAAALCNVTHFDSVL